MKKIAITLSLALVGTMSAFSQGTIWFAGSSSFPITIATSSSGTATKIGAATSNAAAQQLGAGGGQVTIELFVGTSTSSMILAGITTNTLSTAASFQGNFSGNTGYVLGSNPGTSSATFSGAGFAAGNIVDFQYYAFTANGLYTGYSPIETGYALGGGATSATPTFGNTAGLVNGFEMLPAPEPSTMVLSGLGAAALLMFRRRK